MDSVRLLLKENNVLDVFQNYDYQVGQLMYKAMNGQLPVSLRNRLTMENKFFFLKDSRLKQTQKSICYAGPRIWDSLPIQYNHESEFNKFKTCLKQTIPNR